jgi:hypothetical protein
MASRITENRLRLSKTKKIEQEGGPCVSYEKDLLAERVMNLFADPGRRRPATASGGGGKLIPRWRHVTAKYSREGV